MNNPNVEYDWDDVNIPEEYYDSEEWLNLLEQERQADKPDYYARPVKQQIYDHNWQRLKEERLLPPEPEKHVKKISNCRCRVWYNNDRPSIEYDVLYSTGQRQLGKTLNGSWSNEEPKTPVEARAYDAALTMLVRLLSKSKIRFTRFYAKDHVKNPIRDINLLEIHQQCQPQIAYFVVNDLIYPATLNQLGDQFYYWSFNGRNSMSLQEFSDVCWRAVP